MQTFLNDSIHIINCNIIELNNRINVKTPDLANFIQKGWNPSDNGPRGRARPRYCRLEDGCHLKSDVATKWRDHFINICVENRVGVALVLHNPL